MNHHRTDLDPVCAACPLLTKAEEQIEHQAQLIHSGHEHVRSLVETITDLKKENAHCYDLLALQDSIIRALYAERSADEDDQARMLEIKSLIKQLNKD